ncbi:hypothetical protein QZH47_08830 [Pseudomonas corrugata]
MGAGLARDNIVFHAGAVADLEKLPVVFRQAGTKAGFQLRDGKVRGAGTGSFEDQSMIFNHWVSQAHDVEAVLDQ